MSQRKQQGMTLLEVLIAVVILSAGLITVYRPLLASLSTLNYIYSRAEANRLINDKIWEAQQSANLNGRMVAMSGSSDIYGKQKDYRSHFRAKAVDLKSRLYELEYDLMWIEAGKTKNVSRICYVLLPYEK